MFCSVLTLVLDEKTIFNYQLVIHAAAQLPFSLREIVAARSN